MQCVLAVDMGGTTTRFAWFGVGGGQTVEEIREPRLVGGPLRLPTAGAPDFFTLLAEARARGYDPDSADLTVLGVPGAVRDGYRCDPPNISWNIDLKAVGLAPERVRLINDFVAQAWAICSPAGREAEVLQPGEMIGPTSVRNRSVAAAIGAGTGLGHCALVPASDGMIAVPSEGGHAAFAFAPGPEADFASFAMERLGVPYLEREHVVSGLGLALLSEYHTGVRRDPVAAEAALDPEGEVAAWFARFYGRVARDWVLMVLAWGGLWMSGGIALRRPELVRHPAFLKEFCCSAHYASLLGRVPVRRISDHTAGLWGAAMYGAQYLCGAGGVA